MLGIIFKILNTKHHKLITKIKLWKCKNKHTIKTGEWSEFKIIFPAANELGSRTQFHFTMAKSSHDIEPLRTIALTGNTTVLSPPALAFGGVFLSKKKIWTYIIYYTFIYLQPQFTVNNHILYRQCDVRFKILIFSSIKYVLIF